MNERLVAKQSITIQAPAAKVWDVLVNPALIKQWLFGTEAISEWKTGSSITYRGEWKGQPYEDKGTILDIVPERRLVTTYWSGMSGLPDAPENYNKVTYELEQLNGDTEVTIIQENIRSEQAKQDSEKNWAVVLDALKKLLEL